MNFINFINLKRILFILLLLIPIFNIASVVVAHSSIYASRNYWQQFENYKNVYNNSQYINKHPKGWIPDEVVNAYAGGAYVRGVEPQLIAPDTPPLGRYLIGLSAIIFDNVNIITLSCAILLCIGMFLVGKQVMGSSLLALIPPAVFTFEPIFKNQLIYTPLLDIIQLVFLIFSFYFFNKSFSTKRPWTYYLATSFCIGLFISTKFFITGITIIGACMLVLLFQKKLKNLLFFLETTPLTIFILFLTYISALFSGYSLKSFIGIQKWIFIYHKSQLILPFSVWPLLLFNKWYVWYGKQPVISDSQWSFTWPILTILSFVTVVLYSCKKLKKNSYIEVLLAWVVLYILFFSFGQITSRYFVIFIPILYIITVYFFQEIWVLLLSKAESFSVYHKPEVKGISLDLELSNRGRILKHLRKSAKNPRKS